MDLKTLIADANRCNRDDFSAKYPGYYLLLSERADALQLGFRTQIARPGEVPDPSGGVNEVLPIRKAPGNPYPDRISIGRARNCDVVVRHESVSKLHAHFRRRPDDSFDLVDLQSQNGTSINDRRIGADALEMLAPGDIVLFGSLAAVYADSDGLFDALQR